MPAGLNPTGVYFLFYASAEHSRTATIKSLGYRVGACWVNKTLGSVYKHSVSPETCNGKSKTSKDEWEQAKNISFYSWSRTSLQTSFVGVCLCTQRQKLPVYIGMLVHNHLEPCDTQAVVLIASCLFDDAISFLAELRAARSLWGPCPCNDSDLIKAPKYWAAGRQEIKALRKQLMTQNGDLHVLGHR